MFTSRGPPSPPGGEAKKSPLSEARKIGALGTGADPEASNLKKFRIRPPTPKRVCYVLDSAPI